MNVQHSSLTDEWYTPAPIVEAARTVLGTIDLDPASNAQANEIVRATKFYSREQDGLLQPWYGNLFCNPPGGKVLNRSMTGLFWSRLMSAVDENVIDHAIFLCFSLEALQSTQRYGRSVGDYPFCVPSSRIQFVPGRPGVTKTAPSRSNAIVYVPGRVDRTVAFSLIFAKFGKVINVKENR
jgi:hypothetical protein